MRLVVVEDSADIAALLKMAFEREATVEVWTEYFDLLEDEVDWQNVDAAIVDRRLGQYAGDDLLKFLQRDYPNVRRVLLTADSNVRTEPWAHRVLVKPAPMDEIREAVGLDGDK